VQRIGGVCEGGDNAECRHIPVGRMDEEREKALKFAELLPTGLRQHVLQTSMSGLVDRADRRTQKGVPTASSAKRI